jgi:hypothetical protein
MFTLINDTKMQAAMTILQYQVLKKNYNVTLADCNLRPIFLTVSAAHTLITHLLSNSLFTIHKATAETGSLHEATRQ